MFFYFASVFVSDADIGSLSIFDRVSDLQEIKIKSITFSNIKDCTDAAKQLVIDCANELNSKGKSFVVKSEANPAFFENNSSSNFEALSTQGIGMLSNWQKSEMSRIYLTDGSVDQSDVLLTKFIISIVSNPQQEN